MVTLTFDPKINRVLPLPQGNHVAKFGKDPIYRTKVIMQKRSCCQQYYKRQCGKPFFSNTRQNVEWTETSTRQNEIELAILGE
jgi:transposase